MCLVLARPIRWDLAHKHYNDMIRHVVAAKEGTAPIDSLLRRFNRNNPANQTYKGFLELDKALKTIHNCKFLTSEAYRQKIHAERNIAESWNSVIDFIFYGWKSEIQTNDPIAQELTVLCMHLLQNTLVLVNTVIAERVIYDNGYNLQMLAEDKNALTPLFTSNINPYGDIHLDLNKPSFLEALYMERIKPKEMADEIVKLLRKQHPDPTYIKKIFQHVRESLNLKGGKIRTKNLPELLTNEELKRFYNTVWQGFNRVHSVMLKLLLFTGIRNSELANIKLLDVDLEQMKIRIEQGKGGKDRYVLFPPYSRGKLTHYIAIQRENNTIYLFESNRATKFSTRWIREITKKYANNAGITKRIHPHLFRHQILTYLTSKGIVDAKIQLISGHKDRASLSIYQDLSLNDIEKEYFTVMKDFPVQ